MCMMNEYTKKYKCKKNYIHLRCIDDRGINVVKQDIYDFVKQNISLMININLLYWTVDSIFYSIQFLLMGKYNDTYFFCI